MPRPQELALVTVFIKAPSWEEVGGGRLAEAVCDAGALELLPFFEQMKRSGPLEPVFQWPQLLRCFINDAQWERAATLVRQACAAR